MMALVKTHHFNLHVRRVNQVQIDISRFGVKCPDLIGNAGGQYMFFLYLFYRLCLSKVRPSVSNKILSYLILTVSPSLQFEGNRKSLLLIKNLVGFGFLGG